MVLLPTAEERRAAARELARRDDVELETWLELCLDFGTFDAPPPGVTSTTTGRPWTALSTMVAPSRGICSRIDSSRRLRFGSSSSSSAHDLRIGAPQTPKLQASPTAQVMPHVPQYGFTANVQMLLG